MFQWRTAHGELGRDTLQHCGYGGRGFESLKRCKQPDQLSLADPSTNRSGQQGGVAKAGQPPFSSPTAASTIDESGEAIDHGDDDFDDDLRPALRRARGGNPIALSGARG